MTKEIKENLDVLRHWIQQQMDIPTPDPGLSAEERKQLQAVNKAIKQLTRLGVPVPEDLRNLKLQLSNKDVPDTWQHEVKVRIANVNELVDQLGELIKTARSLRKRLKATGSSPFTKRYYGVTMLELIESGYLSIQDRLELQWPKNGPIYEGKLQQNGKVMAKIQGGWKQFNSLSAAASEIAERHVNGWQHWRIVNSAGSRTPLKEIRSRYMSKRS